MELVRHQALRFESGRFRQAFGRPARRRTKPKIGAFGPNDRKDTADSVDRNESVTYVCLGCGAPMIIIEIFERGQLPRAPPRQISSL